jgi:hypothetical protein
MQGAGRLLTQVYELAYRLFDAPATAADEAQ